MSFLEGKITRGGEILSATNFKYGRGFYLFIAPKTSEGASSSIVSLTCLLEFNEKDIEFPFSVGCWSPVLLSSVNITSDILAGYRVFWGAEYE